MIEGFPMDLFAEKKILTVTEFTGILRHLLEENFAHVWVEGEVSNFSAPASGHFYFTVKDAGAQLRCVMFRASARALKFKPKDGMGLILRGRISVYDQRGEYQLIVDYLEPKGIGALQFAFIQLKEKLAKEGLFAAERKKPLPLLPQRIGIVTSPSGAAIHDILNILNRRYANVEVLISPVKVQGEGAAQEIAAAIRDFNRYGKVDVLIVGRGGGSLEDLWAFNEEVVARAIADSTVPVVSAVGHELDFTIADFVADLRAPTPSAAAELVVKSKNELTAEVENLSHRLVRSVERRISDLYGKVHLLARGLKDPSLLLGHLSQRVDDLAERLERAAHADIRRRKERVASMTRHLRLKDPALEVERCKERMIAGAARMQVAMRRILDGMHERMAVHAGKLQVLSPLLTLSRGYSIARTLPEKEVIRSYLQRRPGERLELILHEGALVCTVEKSTKDKP